METKKRALGKGLEQLFANNALNFDALENNIVESTPESDITEVLLSDIRSNPYQPRKTFNEDSLNELAASIKEYGVVQPVILKKSIKGYELIAGERRCKAAKIAGLDKVPAIIKDFSDEEMMEIALLENIQREDLNPIEEAESINSIINLRCITQEEFAKRFGKSRSYITNLLGLLKLPNEVKDMVKNGTISMSHARVLSKLDDDEKIINLAKRIVKEGLNVREVERLASSEPKKNIIKIEKVYNVEKYNIYQNVMSEKLKENVKISKNKIEISFDGEDDLVRILTILDIKVEDE